MLDANVPPLELPFEDGTTPVARTAAALREQVARLVEDLAPYDRAALWEGLTPTDRFLYGDRPGGLVQALLIRAAASFFLSVSSSEKRSG